MQLYQDNHEKVFLTNYYTKSDMFILTSKIKYLNEPLATSSEDRNKILDTPRVRVYYSILVLLCIGALLPSPII